MYLIGMLVLLFLANIFMLMGMTNWPGSVRENFANDVMAGKIGGGKSGKPVEGFTSDLVPGSFATPSMGMYDGVNYGSKLPAASGGWRGTAPNEPLAGPPVEIGPDNLFYFKNNQCKPECCGATLSCDGGCVCTTPEQRDFINTRGGNRKHDDGF